MVPMLENAKIARRTARFLSRVDRSGDCWIWTSFRSHKGYGMSSLFGKTTNAQRDSWQLFVGPIPGSLFVLHRCDVRACVNPKHLFLGNNRDNMIDMVNKGHHHLKKKTHCIRGHEFNESNTYRSKKGFRECRSCRRQRYEREVNG